mmetsp:Transcript_15327/g.38058  ORF Transcript_15327/g.38058 Transcript_15327/m.38058 type:complete len:283 (-) Transcript_15327:258-1106(-)
MALACSKRNCADHAAVSGILRDVHKAERDRITLIVVDASQRAGAAVRASKRGLLAEGFSALRRHLDLITACASAVIVFYRVDDDGCPTAPKTLCATRPEAACSLRSKLHKHARVWMQQQAESQEPEQHRKDKPQVQHFEKGPVLDLLPRRALEGEAVTQQRKLDREKRNANAEVAARGVEPFTVACCSDEVWVVEAPKQAETGCGVAGEGTGSSGTRFRIGICRRVNIFVFCSPCRPRPRRRALRRVLGGGSAVMLLLGLIPPTRIVGGNNSGATFISISWL